MNLRENNMKTLFCSVLFPIVFLSFASCSGGGSLEDIAIKSTTYMLEGKYEKIIDMAEVPDGLSDDELQTMRSELLNLLMEVGTSKYDISYEAKKNGGHKKIEVIPYDSENRIYMNETKDEATVNIKITFENDNTKESNTKLVKQNGVWKLKVS